MLEVVEECEGNWHITFEFLRDAHPELVKQDGPFVMTIMGDAYELLQHCPRIPHAWDCKKIRKADG